MIRSWVALKNKYWSLRLPGFSFQWKIGLFISLLSVSITSLGFYYYYTASYQVTLGLLRKNLRDVGNVGAMLFDQESRNALQRLKERALREAVFDRKIIATLPLGGTTKTISPEKTKELHASDDFQMIRHRLQMISYASFHEAVPLQQHSYDVGPDGFAQGMIATYIEIDLTHILSEDFGMYLVVICPEPIRDIWPGNPIGNLFRSFVPFSRLNEKIYVHNEVGRDEFYQALCATVPILDENNQTIAILGLDYSVGPQLEQLNKLKRICVLLIIASLFFSLLLSFFISRSLNVSLLKLYNAAKKVSQNDYTATVDITSKDEFGLLGQVFNTMLANIRKYLAELDKGKRNLEGLVQKRTQELEEMNEELHLQNDKLEILSTTDTLTGIYNRRYIEGQIQIAINSSKRYGQALSLVMLDIDHFKEINDTYGHDIGDEVLVSIAEILVENIREVDVAGRWGGEEFLILLQADERGAFANAEKLRLKLMAKNHGIGRKVTASFGYSQYSENDTMDSLVKRSDQGLYAAKKNGRNRVETV